MVFSKFKRILLILLLLFIVLFPFWCVKGFCYSSVDVIPLDNVAMVGTTLTSRSNWYGYYFETIVGHTYEINYSTTQQYRLVGTSDQPQVGVSGDLLQNNVVGSYTFKATDKYGFVFSYTEAPFDIEVIDLTEGQTDAVNNLVDNVGISQLWNIFDISINYIVVVVLVAFGIFIISLIIRKISKGKEGL